MSRPTVRDGRAGEKETSKPPSPKPDQQSQEVAPPLISVGKGKPNNKMKLNGLFLDRPCS